MDIEPNSAGEAPRVRAVLSHEDYYRALGACRKGGGGPWPA